MEEWLSHYLFFSKNKQYITCKKKNTSENILNELYTLNRAIINIGNISYNFSIMMMTITAVFHVIHIIASFFAEKSHRLSTGNMERLPAASFVALHTRTNCWTRGGPVVFITDVACLHENTKHASLKDANLIKGKTENRSITMIKRKKIEVH